jgi:hypothetical protein
VWHPEISQLFRKGFRQNIAERFQTIEELRERLAAIDSDSIRRSPLSAAESLAETMSDRYRPRQIEQMKEFSQAINKSLQKILTGLTNLPQISIGLAMMQIKAGPLGDGMDLVTLLGNTVALTVKAYPKSYYRQLFLAAKGVVPRVMAISTCTNGGIQAINRTDHSYEELFEFYEWDESCAGLLAKKNG